MSIQYPKISIVTVVYNGQAVLEDTIKSVIKQDYPDLEYIIIDGASNDGTLDIIKKYDSQITSWISEPDKGVYDAMNKGIDRVKGDWILFMNAGDFFLSESSIYQSIKQSPDLNNYSVLYGDAEFRLKNIAYISEASDTVDSNQYMPFSHQAAFTRTSVAKANKFDLSYKIAADTAFFLRLVKENHAMKHVPVTVCSYNALEGLSADNEVKRCKEIVELQAKWNNINPNDKHFKGYIRNAQIKQFIRKITPNSLWIWMRERNAIKEYKTVSQIGKDRL